MAQYQAQQGTADPNKFNAMITAIDLAVTRALGSGVLAGLTLDAGGNVQPGEALIGHVVALTTIRPAPNLVASSTNYVYLQMPPAPACVGADGRDAGVVVVNQSGALPVSSVLLATLTTGAGAAGGIPITSVNNSPAGRRNLAAPLQGQTQITLAAQGGFSLTPGNNYLLGIDFSAAGTFGSALYQVGCGCTDPNLVISEAKGLKTAGKMFLILHYMLAPGAPTSPVTVSLIPTAEGHGFTGTATTGIAGAYDALIGF